MPKCGAWQGHPRGGRRRHGGLLLAASSGRIAAGPGGLVEIRNATSGSLIASFTPAGTIKALALDGGLVAVLLEGPGGGKRIERYNAGTGAFIASTSISRAAAAELDIAGNRIVLRAGRSDSSYTPPAPSASS